MFLFVVRLICNRFVSFVAYLFIAIVIIFNVVMQPYPSITNFRGGTLGGKARGWLSVCTIIIVVIIVVVVVVVVVVAMVVVIVIASINISISISISIFSLSYQRCI